jgi:hypothetical protein
VSRPADGSYKAGQNLDFTVTFNENVTVVTTGGTPTIGLTIGSTARNATYVANGSTATTLLFRYTIANKESSDLDGIAVASSIALNGGTIKDAASNNAGLSFSPLNTSGVVIQ